MPLQINAKSPSKLHSNEMLPTRAELKAFQEYEEWRYGYATGFDLSNGADCQWLRGYRYARSFVRNEKPRL